MQTHLGLELEGNVRDHVTHMVADYNRRSNDGAIAIALDAEGDISIGYAFADRPMTASQHALQRCETERSKHVNVGSPCEIVFLNNEAVATASTLKAPYGPQQPSFLWRVDGGEVPVFVGGTIHLMKPSLYPLNTALRNAYNQTDQLAVEADVLQIDPAEAAKLQKLMVADPEEVDAALSENLRDHLTAFSTITGIPFQALLGIQPNMLSADVAVARLTALGYTPTAGIDRHFLTRAAADGKPIIELESLAYQMALMTSPSIATQAKLLEQTFDELENANGFLEEMVSSWLAGDAETLYEATSAEYEDPEFAEFGRRFLDERNARMGERIIGLLKGDRATLVLVGAAHFGGPSGILAHLKKAGYGLTQVPRGG